ncbi:hypothetical protein HDU92_005896 [Lobulomyces angularis]|nr:hypothetical protein HDU92_005896 [Lobulomyces angularis]
MELIENNDLSNDEKLASIIELTKICYKPEIKKKRRLTESPSLKYTSFLQICPEDVLYCIFLNLDVKSLLTALEVCSYWNLIIRKSEKILWQELCKKTFNVIDQNNFFESFKQKFATQVNIKNGNYVFSIITEDTKIFKNPLPNFVDYSLLNGNKLNLDVKNINTKNKIVFAWPCDSSQSYHLASDSNNIYWIDDANSLSINVSCIDDLVDFDIDKEEKPVKTISFLTNHTSSIGLVLSNNEGTLITFDNHSVIKVWDLKNFTCERTLNENKEHGFIMSINIYKRKLVTGGENGKVLLWDLDSGEVIISLEIPDEYISHLNVDEMRLLNVSIWENTLVYGLFDGSFHVFDLTLGRIVYIFTTTGGLNVTHFKENEGKAIHLNGQAESVVAYAVVSDDENEDYLDVESENDDVVEDNNAVETNSREAHRQINETLRYVPQIPPFLQHFEQDTVNNGQIFQHAPKTLALNGHILITNGTEADEIAVWDLIKGEVLYVLSESESLKKFNFNIPPFRDILYAEISKDGSTIFTSVNYEDFRMNKTLDRHFKKFATISKNIINDEITDNFVEFWVVYETL